jgi:hypothetical protein
MKLMAVIAAVFFAGLMASFALAEDGHGSSGSQQTRTAVLGAPVVGATTITLPGGGKGKSGKETEDGHGSSGSQLTRTAVLGAVTTTTSQGGDKGKVTCRPSIELEFRGTVAAAPTPTALVILVSNGGGEGSSLAGKQLTLDPTLARMPAGLKQGDLVQVHGRACVDLVAGTVKLVATEVSTRKTETRTNSSTSTSTTTSTIAKTTTSTTTSTTTTTTPK